MRERVIEDLLGRQPHARLLRFLAATAAGLQGSFLTEDERAAARDLEEAGVLQVVASERLELTAAAREALEERREQLRALDEAQRTAEAERLESRLSFLHRLSEAAQQRRTVADLFRSSFTTFYDAAPFDVGVAVLLEQNLDAYVARRSGLEDPLSDRFAEEVKRTMGELLAVSFEGTDLVIQGNFEDLPGREAKRVPWHHVVATLLKQQNRTAGLLAIFSAEPFPADTQRLLEILSSQVSMVLSGIRNTERIQNLADTDDLTGIWNKRWLRRQLPNEIERARIYGIPLSLAMLDIDDFKTINDSHGHVIGDVLLSELCGTVRETLRPPDMLARFGGDEFALVLPHGDIYGARAVAERILQRARDLRIMAADGVSEVRCSVSIGLASYVPPEMTSAELIQRADERLYEAKRQGKNRIAW